MLIEEKLVSPTVCLTLHGDTEESVERRISVSRTNREIPPGTELFVWWKINLKDSSEQIDNVQKIVMFTCMRMA